MIYLFIYIYIYICYGGAGGSEYSQLGGSMVVRLFICILFSHTGVACSKRQTC